MELRTLYGLEDELASLDEILEESKNVFGLPSRQLICGGSFQLLSEILDNSR